MRPPPAHSKLGPTDNEGASVRAARGSGGSKADPPLYGATLWFMRARKGLRDGPDWRLDVLR